MTQEALSGLEKPAVVPIRGFTVILLLLAGAGLWVPPCAAGPADQAAQTSDEEDTPRKFRFVFRNYPSFRFGKFLRIDLRYKLQADIRSYSPELDTDEGTFDLRRARVGIGGKLWRYFEYEVEYEMRDALRSLAGAQEDGGGSNRWRDVYLNFNYFSNFQIKAGKFKIPMGQDQLTGPTRLDFVHRSRIGDTLAPARDIGAAVHGRFFKRGLSYEAGIFERDGENARFGANPGAERTFAGRITGTPVRLLQVPSILKTVELGLALTSSTVPEGAKGIRGRTTARESFFPLQGDRMFVHGQRLRVGTDLSWSPGPFSLKGEFIHFRDERLAQSLRQADLPDLISRGWFVSGTWAVTGEPKAPGIEPRKNFLRRGGAGAIELAARYEQIRFGSSEHPGPPLRHQRAPNILSASDRVLTFGANWYLNRWLKIQFNAIKEKIEDTMRAPALKSDIYWTRVWRFQVLM